MNPAGKQDPSQDGLVIRGLRSNLAGPFDLEIASGEAVVVTGRSGSGKSLFLRMLADLDVNDGAVCLDGVDRAAIPAPKWRSLVTYVAAESGWWFDTVSEHFLPEELDEASRVAADLGLSRDLLRAPVSHLSSGERQRWALIRAALKSRRALLLDEPTGALDPLSVEPVEELLHRLRKEGTILILVTHDPGLAARTAGKRFQMIDRKLQSA